MTTPIRETIARAVIKGLQEQPGHESEQPYINSRGDYDNLSAVRVDGDCNLISAADAVLRALDEAGCVVVRKEPDDAMVWAGCTEIVRAHGRECKRCPPLVETPYGAGTQACRLEAEDIYRAMISAHTGQDSNGADVSVSVVE